MLVANKQFEMSLFNKKSALDCDKKLVGGLVDTSSQCKASFGHCICNKNFSFYYPAFVNLRSFWTDGFIYSALKDSEITGHIDTAMNCSSYAKTYKLIYVCFLAIVQISIKCLISSSVLLIIYRSSVKRYSSTSLWSQILRCIVSLHSSFFTILCSFIFLIILVIRAFSLMSAIFLLFLNVTKIQSGCLDPLLLRYFLK